MMMWTTQGDPRPAFGRMFLVTLLVCCLSATKMAAAAGEQMADFAIQANRGQIYWQVRVCVCSNLCVFVCGLSWGGGG